MGLGAVRVIKGQLCPCQVLKSMKAQASEPGSGVLTLWEPPPKGLISTESGSLVTQLPLQCVLVFALLTEHSGRFCLAVVLASIFQRCLSHCSAF